MAGNTARPGESVTSRALALLGAFDETHRSLTLTQLAERADIPVPTAHRLLRDLVAWGALARRPTGEYVVGRRMWTLGLLAGLHTNLKEAASPFLNDVHAATHATVHLAVRDRLKTLYVDRLGGTSSLPIVSSVGSRLPLHATGVGKVLLAYAPPAVRLAVLQDLERVTRYTITQPGLLEQQLRAVERNGYAKATEEMSLGASSVAVPVRRGDEVVAALGIVVPDLRAAERKGWVTALNVAAQGISRSLGDPSPLARG